MEIEERYKLDRTIYYIYWEHLGWWKRRRFVNFFLERTRNGIPFLEAIQTWNERMQRPEDTVYYVTKDVKPSSESASSESH